MELIDITPEDSVVPVYLEVLNEEEQTKRDVELAKIQEEQEAREAEQQRLVEVKASAVAKLVSGKPLTEEEAKVLVP